MPDTDQRLRSTTAPTASAIYKEHKQERFDNRYRLQTSVAETWLEMVGATTMEITPKIAGCCRSHHTKHAPAPKGKKGEESNDGKRKRNLLHLLHLDWCREGELNPHEVAFDGF